MFLAVGSVALRLSNRALALAAAYAVQSMAMKSTAMMPIGTHEQMLAPVRPLPSFSRPRTTYLELEF
jgi:hypothetical protein